MSDFDLDDDFLTQEYSPTFENNPLPIGMYTAVAVKAVIKDTKDRTGKYLEVEFDITSPSQYSNRKFWDRFNYKNKSQDAQRIAKKALSDLIKQMGFTHEPKAEELIGRSVSMYLVIEAGKNGYEDKNKCSKYFPVGSTQSDYDAWRGKGGKSPDAAKPVAKPVAGKTPPWSKK